MPTIRRDADKVVSVRKDVISRRDMSRGAKGLLVELLSMNDRRVLDMDRLYDSSTDGMEETERQIDELSKAGYLVIDGNRDEWHVSDVGIVTSMPKPPKRQRRFERPTPEMVETYALEQGSTIDGTYFCDYYDARGWELKGGRHMKDWRAAVRTWLRRERRTDGRELPEVFAAYED